MSSNVTDTTPDLPEDAESAPDGPEDVAAASQPEAADALEGRAEGGEASADAPTAIDVEDLLEEAAAPPVESPAVRETRSSLMLACPEIQT